MTINTLLKKAFKQQQQGKLQEALAYINQAIGVAPYEATLHNNKGHLLSQLNQIDQAIASYQQAITIDPHYATPYSNMGTCCCKQKRYDQAKHYYQKAIQLDDRAYDAYYNLGCLLAKDETNQAKIDLAIVQLKKAITIHPQHGLALKQLAHLELYRSHYNEATTYYQRALELSPYHTDLRYHYALTYLKAGHLSESIRHFQTVLKQNPAYEKTHYYLATAYLKQGKQAEALRHYFQQTETEKDLLSYYNIAVLLMYQERHQEALNYFNEVLNLYPNCLDAHANMGAIYLKKHDIQQAKKHYQMMDDLQSGNQEIRYILTALQQTESPDAPPHAYIIHLFDQYAPYYDQHLTEHLKYHIPKQMHHCIEKYLHPDEKQWRILDLGCGTGLCGEYLKPYAYDMIGIDLSPAMLKIAKQKKIYDHLIEQSLEEALTLYRNIDLIVSADVFTYVGNLEEIFKSVKKMLSTNGAFIFTTEKNDSADYHLQTTMRYAHSKDYLNRLIERNNFVIVSFNEIELRKQYRASITGYFYLLRKSI